MPGMLHELSEPSLEECMEQFRRLAGRLPRRDKAVSMDTYVIYWASFKRQLAVAAARCLLKLVPAVKAVYYTELSEDYAGRDVDLVIVLEENLHGFREVEDTIEAILSKLARAAGIDEGDMSLFEVHLKDSFIGSRSHLVLLAQR